MPKQKGNVQTTLKKLIGFFEVFATSAQHFKNPMEKGKNTTLLQKGMLHV